MNRLAEPGLLDDGARPSVPLVLARMGLAIAGLAVLVFWMRRSLSVEIPRLEPGGLILALLCNQAALVVAGLRLRATLAAFDIGISRRQAFLVHLRSLFYYFFVPMSVGLEVSRFIIIRRAVRTASPRALLVALFLDRVLGMAAALILAAVLAFALPVPDRLKVAIQSNSGWALAACASVLLLGAALLAFRGLRQRLRNAVEAARDVGSRLPVPMLLSLAALGLVCACAIAFAHAAAIDVGWLPLTFVLSAGLLASAIPVSLLGAGLGEVAGAGGLVLIGLPAGHAILLASVVYCGRLLGAMQGALVEIWKATSFESKGPGTAPAVQRETERTIEDFGDQWVRFTDNSGYYGSSKLFADIAQPLITEAQVEGQRVADIGSGTGRIVGMLLSAGAAHVTAIEPSRAFGVLSARFAGQAGRVACCQLPGEGIAALGPFDLVVSVGVLHHIPRPAPVVAAAYQALRPGGRMFVWLYGREGNAAYLALVTPLRALTKRLPDRVVDGIVRVLDVPLAAYIGMCRFLPLPMRAYMLDHLGRLDADKRRLTIFDQLNPSYAKYYRRSEAHALLAEAGFKDIALHHRHGYSWSVIGSKPALGSDGKFL